jgi:CRISPR/Cas system CMR subunit Cmr4 (Cas7 group RAMP superfamily)
LCLATILKKHKEKGKKVLKNENKKPHQKQGKERKGKKKFRSACILCIPVQIHAELYCCLLDLGPGRV